jgi:hypothetical protein
LSAVAEMLRQWLPVRDPYKSYIFKLAAKLEPPQTGDDGDNADEAVEFWKKFCELRQQQAARLFELGRQAHGQKEYALALDLVREACREDPDHAAARAILGYVRHKDHWLSPDAARRQTAGQAFDEKYGWLPAGDRDRYEKGQRFYRGRWISAEEDERLHSSIRAGWRIDGEHYVVTTNHSLEEGVQLSRRLETLFDVWRHIFIDYCTPETVMRSWFEAGDRAGSYATPAAHPVPRVRHQVTHFRNKQEYDNALRSLQPQIEITLGIYFGRLRNAYFFAGDKQYSGTLLHEATHQLFQETRPTQVTAGTKDNFWAIEAVACYMESLVEHEHWYTLGGIDQGRAPAARFRLLEDRFQVPLDELVRLGMTELQHDDRLPKVYSQIAGQAWFFLNGQDGRYRRAFVDYLSAVYANKADAATLAKLCGQSYEQLDLEYRQFMQAATPP